MKRRNFLTALGLIPFINPEEIAKKVAGDSVLKKMIKQLPEGTPIKYFTMYVPDKVYDTKFLGVLGKNIPDILDIEAIPHKAYLSHFIRGIVPFTTQNGFRTDSDLKKCVSEIYKECALQQKMDYLDSPEWMEESLKIPSVRWANLNKNASV